MAEKQGFDAAEFADHLSPMTDEELFALMQKLRKRRCPLRRSGQQRGLCQDRHG